MTEPNLPLVASQAWRAAAYVCVALVAGCTAPQAEFADTDDFARIGATESLPDLPDVSLDTGESGSGSGSGGEEEECEPTPVPLAWCLNPEEPPPTPVPPSGECAVELILDSLSFDDGQGFTEGKAEASVTIDVTDLDTGAVASLTAPGGAGFYKIPTETEYTINELIGEYAVQEGDQRHLEVCATFLETDDDDIDINGDNDVGTACEVVTLRCPQTQAGVTLGADLCKGGDCTKINGSMSAGVTALAADADGDCVPNIEDYTPEICAEHWKGQLCRASLEYFHYGDGPITSLVQHVGTDLTKALTGYDRTVLLVDDQQVGPFNLNAAAINLADVVMPPTEQNFFASLQDLTAEGCDIDVWIHSHGWAPVELNTTTNAFVVDRGEISALADDDPGTDNPDITSDELAEDTAPENSGTSSVPVRMTYATACNYREWNQAWLDAGAKVTSGARDISFVPTYFPNFADNWDAGLSYTNSLAAEGTVADEALAFGFIAAEGALPPYWCVTNTVLGNNACAEDFFIDSDSELFADVNGDRVNGPDEARYTIGGPLQDTIGVDYDTGMTGADNMRRSSFKEMAGNGAVGKNVPPTLSWP